MAQTDSTFSGCGILFEGQQPQNWKLYHGTSLVVQWLGLWASTTAGTGFIPGQGTGIPHAASWSQKTNKQTKLHHSSPPLACSTRHSQTDHTRPGDHPGCRAERFQERAGAHNPPLQFRCSRKTWNKAMKRWRLTQKDAHAIADGVSPGCISTSFFSEIWMESYAPEYELCLSPTGDGFWWFATLLSMISIFYNETVKRSLRCKEY